MTCSGCGLSLQPDFAFCPRCGVRVGATAPAGSSPGGLAPPPAPARNESPAAPFGDEREETDRRLVSVLFADVSGFTALSERWDPEDLRAFQNDLFEEMSSAIQRYDGFVEKFVGDAVMAVFGAPRAHEDDPERAVRAALSLHERVTALGRRWERRLGRILELHIGVNTGPVVAGTLGSVAEGAYAVTGDTVNIAARLQALAESGQTLISRSTYLLVRHAFLFDQVGEVAVKGKSQPVQVFRVTGVRPSPGSGRGLETLGLGAPMVGRADELAQVLAAVERMLNGRAQIVSLIGDAGVGKSRLLRETLAALEAGQRLGSGAVRQATCSALGEQPYGTFAAFVREAYGVALEDPLEVARQKLACGLAALGADAEEAAAIGPLLAYVLGVESDDRFRHLEPEQLKRQIFLALRRLIERRLQQGPLVLVVEDLHWADSVSVELFQFLVERLADQRFMVVATYRPSFDPRALATARAAHTAIRLSPLSADDSAALLNALFGASIACMPERLRQLVLGRAGGHPLYLEEIVRSLIADGVLVRGADGWACTAEAATVDVPPTVHGLLRARVDRLGAEDRRLLQEASVLGLGR